MEHDNISSLKQKRARSQLSCTHCRQGKLKCDRSRPCDQCSKRDRAAACAYPPPAARSRGQNNVKSRIQHLEQLVVDLMNNKTSPSDNSTDTSSSQTGSNLTVFTHRGDAGGRIVNQLTPPESGGEDPISTESVNSSLINDPASSAFGQLTVDGTETSYVGSAHWASILGSISDLKLELETSNNNDIIFEEMRQDNEPQNDLAGPSDVDSLLRSPKRLSKSELLESFPPKQVVDQLVATWFNSTDPFKAIIHKIQFESEYRQFWKDPTKAPVMWIGMLYAIMGLGCFFRLHTTLGITSQNASSLCIEADKYRNFAASAAVLADYTTPKAFTIECLLLYTGSPRTKMAPFDAYALLGIVARLALRMGYHRDASHYGNISPYTCEMRRRTYAALYMADTLTSFQVGLPAILRSVQSDTKPPHNLLDQDFGIHDKILPAERPLEEFTPSAYTNAKLRIIRAFSDAAELTHATRPPSYSDIMIVDSHLERAHSLIPPSLRTKAYEMSVTDTPETTLCCMSLEIMYLKTKCVLHRRFMTSTATKPAEPYSRKSCLESALKLLRHNLIMSELSQPGGRLERMAWYIEVAGKSDFLMAAMIVCVELSQQCSRSSTALDPADEIIASREEMIEIMEKTQAIWETTISRNVQASTASEAVKRHSLGEAGLAQETVKACKAMRVMLQMVRARRGGVEVANVGFDSGVQQATGQAAPFDLAGSYPGDEQPWQSTLPEGAVMEDYSMLAGIMDGFENIDWTTWDQQLTTTQPVQEDFLDWSMQGNDVYAQGDTIAQFDPATFESGNGLLPF